MNVVLNDKSATAEGFKRAAKILKLIIELETEKYDLLEYSIKSAYIYLHKRNGISKIELLLLKFIKNILKNKYTTNGLTREFEKLKTALEKFRADRFDSSLLDVFDYISWIQSKIERRPFADCVRRRATLPAKLLR